MKLLRIISLTLLMLLPGTVSAELQTGVSDIEMVEKAAAQARAALSSGDYMLARAAYNTGRSYSPDDEADDMMRLIGSEICFATGDYKQSLALADSVTTPRYNITRAAHIVRAMTMLDMHDRAVEVADSILATPGITGDAYAVLLQNRGYAFWDAGNLTNAADDIKLALDMISEPVDRMNLMGNLAVIESEIGNHDRALTLISEVTLKLHADTPDGIVALRKKAEILRRAGKKADADRVFRKYFTLEKKALSQNLPNMTATARLNLWMKEKALLARCFDSGSDPAFMYDVAVFRRLTSLMGMRDYEALSGLIKADHIMIRRALHKGEAAIEIVEYNPTRGNTSYAALVLPYKDTPKFIPLTDDEEIFANAYVGGVTIEEALRRESPNLKNVLYSDSVLGDKIWRPILNALPADVHDIYFAPEGIFHIWGIENMPFSGSENYKLHRVTSTAALTRRNKGTCAGDSVLIIGGLDYNRVESDSIYGSGNRDASMTLEDLGVQTRFNYLKGTETEADSIARIIPDAHVSHSMGESRLKALMPDYDLIHIATHGYSLSLGVARRPEFLADSIAVDRSLLASGLALSGANKGYDPKLAEDGLLSAREICDLDLRGVDFVILSACRTAMGDIKDEAPAGLVRALKMAGVKSIIATLWEVDDLSTMLFMQTFHKELASGADKYDAFVRARQRVKEQPTPVAYRPYSPGIMARGRGTSLRLIPPFSQPYYWAPFILIDDF